MTRLSRRYERRRVRSDDSGTRRRTGHGASGSTEAPIWFTRSKMRREAAFAAAAARDAVEQRAARRRMLDQATVLLPVVLATRRAPLLTPGQAARADQVDR